MSPHPAPEALDRYADGELEPDEAAAVDQHLVECTECREQVLRIRAFTDQFRRAFSRPMPASFNLDAAALVAGVPQLAVVDVPPQRPARAWWVLPAVAGAAVAAMVLVSLAARCLQDPSGGDYCRAWFRGGQPVVMPPATGQPLGPPTAGPTPANTGAVVNVPGLPSASPGMGGGEGPAAAYLPLLLVHPLDSGDD